MTNPTDVLDAAYERLGRWGFDDPDGYVNHGPMVCEALDALGRPAEVDSWSRADTGTPPVAPVEPRRFVWTEALGEPGRAGEWMGHFERAMAEQGWAPVLHEWLPRLLPGLGTALFHGLIRCAHAARAIEAADTPARRSELVRSLGYWAALRTDGEPPEVGPLRGVDDVQGAVLAAASHAARHYLARPNIIHLHGITAAMAVSLLIRHVDEAAAVAALGHLRAEQAALHGSTAPAAVVPAPTVDQDTLVAAAIASGEAHAVKLVEASTRGFAVTDDPAFLAAAERSVRRGLRKLAQAEPG